MNDWIEIFRTGTFTANNGRMLTYDISDLDRIVQTYDPRRHEAPLVIGHPKDNHPAWGWVAALKRVGNRLLMLPKQVVPEFSELVKAGMFKKRSISLYPDGSLRHVGFLGAMPPAVKGLGDISFNEYECQYVTFEIEGFGENFSECIVNAIPWDLAKHV